MTDKVIFETSYHDDAPCFWSRWYALPLVVGAGLVVFLCGALLLGV